MRTQILLLACVILTACASRPDTPTSTELQFGRDLSAAGFSAVIGGCVVFDSVGKERLLLEESEAAIQGLKARLYALANENKLGLKRIWSPLVCSNLSASRRNELAILRGIPTSGRRFLIPNRDSDSTTDIEALTLLELFLEKSWAAVDSYRGSIALGSAVPVSISPAHTQQLSTKLEARFVVVLRGLGAALSEGERVKSTILSGLSPLTINDGANWHEGLPGEGLFYQVALIDLRKNQILWAKTADFTEADVQSPLSYRGSWSQDLLVPLFSKARDERIAAPDTPFFQ